MCLSPDVIGCYIGGPRILEDKARASSTLALEMQLAILGLGMIIRCLIEALVCYTGTGPEFCLGVIEHGLAGILLLNTLDAGVLFHSCILGASSWLYSFL